MVGNNMLLLAHGGFEMMAMIVLIYFGPMWATGIAGFLFTFSRTGRKPAMVLAFITIGFVILFELLMLWHCEWSLWKMIVFGIEGGFLIWTAPFLAVPCTLAVITFYRCRKDRPLK